MAWEARLCLSFSKDMKGNMRVCFWQEMLINFCARKSLISCRKAKLWGVVHLNRGKLSVEREGRVEVYDNSYYEGVSRSVQM